MKFNSILFGAAVAVALLSSPAVAQAPSAAIMTKSGPLGTPTAGNAMVVFYRPASMMGMALGCTIREGEGAAIREVARLGGGKYWTEIVTPGTHEYRTQGERSDLVTLSVEADKTYFVKCLIGVGLVAGSARIEQSDVADFDKKAKGLKRWARDADKGSAEANQAQ
jgi:hypothetical protein